MCAFVHMYLLDMCVCLCAYRSLFSLWINNNRIVTRFSSTCSAVLLTSCIDTSIFCCQLNSVFFLCLFILVLFVCVCVYAHYLEWQHSKWIMIESKFRLYWISSNAIVWIYMKNSAISNRASSKPSSGMKNLWRMKSTTHCFNVMTASVKLYWAIAKNSEYSMTKFLLQFAMTYTLSSSTSNQWQQKMVQHQMTFMFCTLVFSIGWRKGQKVNISISWSISTRSTTRNWANDRTSPIGKMYDNF